MSVRRGAGIATLPRREAATAVTRHPQLADPDAVEPVVVMVSARDEAEAAELADLISLAKAALRSRNEAAHGVLRALLPEDQLSISAGVLTQLRHNAEAQRALAAEFGLLSSAEVGTIAGSKARNAAALASRWRTEGRIFGVPVDGSVRYPGFQLEDGKPRPVVAETIKILGGHLAGWELALWFTGDNDWLGGVRPVDALTGTAADRDAVLAAAQHLADELAD
ncbi:MAG TPA: hypothetical protein VLC50_00865 [Actinomycetes bacterium]|nr:hypothetical protein [Actinomycetes bacterium]